MASSPSISLSPPSSCFEPLGRLDRPKFCILDCAVVPIAVSPMDLLFNGGLGLLFKVLPFPLMPSRHLAWHFFAATTSIMDYFVFIGVPLTKHRFRPLSYSLLIRITTQ